MNIELPFSPSCERNRTPILDVLGRVFPVDGKVLEIGSCTGQHIVFFAPRFPGLTWQPSDRSEHLPGLAARISSEGSQNIRAALELDVMNGWPEEAFNAIYSANTSHIMSWEAVCAMFGGVGKILLNEGVFCLYGPFNEGGGFTSQSNREFDRDLRLRNPVMGLRDLADLESLALGHQLRLEEKVQLPANNQVLVFRKTPA